MNGTFLQIIMSAKMASTLAVKSVVTLQVATIALADQGTILMATLERAKVCAACHEDQGRSQDFSKGGSQTGTPSADRRLYMVYTTALPRVSAGSVVSSRHEGPY